jgi:hypothetical protein
VDFLSRIGLFPIAESTSHRISFELDSIDFDIDEFSGIPPFLEIDMGDSAVSAKEILEKLQLSSHEVLDVSTPGIYEKMGLDYFEMFKIK